VSPQAFSKKLNYLKREVGRSSSELVSTLKREAVTQCSQINEECCQQVTMVDRGAAERACKDANPIIDGRKANVNLAYLGAKPLSSQTCKFF